MNHREMMQALLNGDTLVVNNIGDNYELHLCPKTQMIKDIGDITVCWIPHPNRDVTIKQRTININGFEVPAPLHTKPEDGTTYFKPSIKNAHVPVPFRWYGLKSDDDNLSAGLVHLTKEAAILHATALLSFTKQP